MLKAGGMVEERSSTPIGEAQKTQEKEKISNLKFEIFSFPARLRGGFALLPRRLHAAGSLKIEVHRLTDFEKQHAGIFHSPLHVGNRKLRRRVPVVEIEIECHGHGDFMLASMDSEHSVDLHRRGARERHFAIDTVRTERDLRVARAFEDILVHLLVAPSAAAIAAGRIEHNGSVDLSRHRIEPDIAAL